MSKKNHHRSMKLVEKKDGISRFSILEDALKITYIIIKIAIAIVVPSGKRLYDPGVLF